MTEKLTTRVECRDYILERMFAAPREQVYRAFSEANHLKHWWGPRGWTVPVCKVDFRPGGVWHYCMKCEDPDQGEFFGMESWGKGVYNEIEVPRILSYTDYFSDAEGHIVEGMPPSEIWMEFIDQDGSTGIISTARFESAEALKSVLEMGMEQGIAETWDRLAEYLLAMDK